MINIAVMLSGSGRYLDITQGLFKWWNNLYEDVNFSFYVSTWEDDIDYNNFKWITKWERLKEEDCPYDLKNHPGTDHAPHYTYTLKKVNELRNSHDVVFDAVLQTRCDYVFPKKLLDDMISQVTQIRGGWDTRPYKQVSPRNIFSASGTSIHSAFREKINQWKYDLWTNDYYFFGHPKVFDVFAKMFDYMYIDENTKGKLVPMMHIFQAEYLNLMGIYNTNLKSVNGVLIREQEGFEPHDTITKDKDGNKIYQGGWDKNNPSPIQLQNMINRHGVKWIYKDNNFDYIKSLFNRIPK